MCSGINLEYLYSTIDADGHGSGTKSPLNVVGHFGVLQGTAGDLRTGLPSQMTEFHPPVRALFVVDAPIARVESVLERRAELRQLVRNDWVRFLVRDPASGKVFRQCNGAYVPVAPQSAPGAESGNSDVAAEDRRHAAMVAHREDRTYALAKASMLLACAAPIVMFGTDAMSPYGVPVALGSTLLALPVLKFSRRYLHGEHMFPRFAFLCASLLLVRWSRYTPPTCSRPLFGPTATSTF